MTVIWYSRNELETQHLSKSYCCWRENVSFLFALLPVVTIDPRQIVFWKRHCALTIWLFVCFLVSTNVELHTVYFNLVWFFFLNIILCLWMVPVIDVGISSPQKAVHCIPLQNQLFRGKLCENIFDFHISSFFGLSIAIFKSNQTKSNYFIVRQKSWPESWPT